MDAMRSSPEPMEFVEPISNSQMNDVCSATVADARRHRAQMGVEPFRREQTPQVPSGRQGFQPGTSRRALLKHIIALCIVIFEFEIGSN